MNGLFSLIALKEIIAHMKKHINEINICEKALHTKD